MRAPADDDVAVFEQQRGALILLHRVEGHRAAARVVTGARHRRLNADGTV